MSQKKPKSSLKEKYYIRYNDFPITIKNKIWQASAIFILGSFLMGLLFAGLKMYPMILLCLAFAVWGILNALSIYLKASSNKIAEIEGVIIDVETSGMILGMDVKHSPRNRHTNLLIQTVDGEVYRIRDVNSRNKYLISNKVRFYTLTEEIKFKKNDEYCPITIYGIEKLASKITTDEEDEMIAKLNSNE